MDSKVRLNKKPFRPKADTKDELLNTIAEIRSQEKTERDNKKFNLSRPTVSYIPTLAELLDEVLPFIENDKGRRFTDRVFNDFLYLLPVGLKITELTTFHFQSYINRRRGMLGHQTNKPLKPQSINKELYAISAVLRQAPKHFADLESYKRPPIPFLPEEDSVRELNITLEDFYVLLDTLRKPREGRQTIYTEQHRRRLADELEFRLETGLRRKEVARLEFKQYIQSEGILKAVRRWKTKTITKIFPLTKRAVELVEARAENNNDSRFIFTKDGEPVESDYRTLKIVCAELYIPYGRFTDEGFVPHDLRHQAATETVRATDITTAQKYLGHSTSKQTETYLRTDAARMKEAVRLRDEAKQGKKDVEKQLKTIFAEVKNGSVSEENFIENMKKLFGI